MRRKQRLNKATIFRDRVDKARTTIPFIKVNKFDKSGKPKDLFVPGSLSKTYNVLITRADQNRIFVECFIHLGANGNGVKCRGSLNSVCYHAIGAIIHAIEKKGYKASVSAVEASANIRSRIGGEVYKIISKNVIDNPLWIVASKKEPKTAEENIKELGY